MDCIGRMRERANAKIKAEKKITLQGREQLSDAHLSLDISLTSRKFYRRPVACFTGHTSSVRSSLRSGTTEAFEAAISMPWCCKKSQSNRLKNLLDDS